MHRDRLYQPGSILRFIVLVLSRPRTLLLLLARLLVFLAAVTTVLSLMGAYLIVRDPIYPADALVPLAGDPARVEYAAQIVNQGDAQWLLVTNMAHDWLEPTNAYSTRTSREATEYGISLNRIFVAGQPVSTTYEEALIIREFVERQDWQSLIVVTSPPHTRRSRMMFHEVFQGSTVDVMIIPVEDHWYTPILWWQSKLGWSETAQEYIKLLLYRLGYR